MAKAQTTTGIFLFRHNQTGAYSLTREGRPTLRYSAEVSFAGIALLAGLSNGYWLRSTPTPTATTWTWVQL